MAERLNQLTSKGPFQPTISVICTKRGILETGDASVRVLRPNPCFSHQEGCKEIIKGQKEDMINERD